MGADSSARRVRSRHLAHLVRVCGARGKYTEEIIRIAYQELGATFCQPDIRVMHNAFEEVRSLVAEAVWRWWIPAAKRNLKSGIWSTETILTNLRTSLCCYAKSKRSRVMRRENRIMRHELRVASLEKIKAEEPSQFIDVTDKEQQFLARTSKGIDLKKFGKWRIMQGLKILLTIKRSTTDRPFRHSGSWKRLLIGIIESIEEP